MVELLVLPLEILVYEIRGLVPSKIKCIFNTLFFCPTLLVLDIVPLRFISNNFVHYRFKKGILSVMVISCLHSPSHFLLL